MSSIIKASGGKSEYNELKILKADELKSKNIVLIVLDGLGYEYLTKHCKDTFLAKNISGRITSVFPSTTAAAVTTFLTGLAPQEHGITGWFMHLKEFGMVTTIIKSRARIGGKTFSNMEIDPKMIFDMPGIGELIKRDYYVITHDYIIDTDYNRSYNTNTKSFAYNDIEGMFSKTLKAIKDGKRKKFIFSYWGDLDYYLHTDGTESSKPKARVQKIDKLLQKFIKDIKDTDTTLIITADHGLTDTPLTKYVNLEDHPILNSTMTLPFAGDKRVAYCYVRPSKAKIFERYVKAKLSGKVIMYKSEELAKKNIFGLHKMHYRFLDRIGDYVLIAKDHCAFTDRIAGRDGETGLANHSGLSKEEMFVPLIVIKD